MRVVVTGATGVLGSALTEALLNRGDRVVALSRSPTHPPPKLARLQAEILPYSEEGMSAALASGPVDVVVHTACSYGRDGETMAELTTSNVVVPLRLALSAGTRVGRWLNIGTSLPKRVSPYALSKHQFVEWLEALSEKDMAKRVHVSLEHFFGPECNDSNFISHVARACLANEFVNLTDGLQERDFVYLSDVVRALLTLVDTDDELMYRTVSLGSGQATSIKSVAETIQQTVGRGVLNLGAMNRRPHEPTSSSADIAYLRSLGWEPKVSLDEGIRHVIEAERNRLHGRDEA
jgi:CDP-paratose synthetase